MASENQPASQEVPYIPEMLQHVTHIAALVASGVSIEHVLADVCHVTASLCQCDRAGVLLYEPERDEFVGQPSLWHNVSATTAPTFKVSRRTCESGVCGAVLTGQEAVLVEVPAACPCAVLPDGTISRLCTALKVSGKVVGVLWVDNALTKRPIPRPTSALLTRWAQTLAACLASATRLHETERHLLATLRLADLAGAIIARRNLDDILHLLRDALVESGLLDRVGIFLYDREEQILKGTWGTDRAGYLEDAHGQRLDPLDPTNEPLYRVVFGEEPYFLWKEYTHQEMVPPGDGMYGVRFHVIVPIRAGSHTYGVVAGDNLLTDRPIRDTDIRVLLSFARQAAVAIMNAELIGELTAARDHLEEQVRERTDDVRSLQAEIGSMLQTLTHDFRSPVRAAEAFSAELLSHYKHILPAPAVRDLERVREAALRLGELTDNLLAIGRLSRRSLDLQNVDPASLARDVYHRLRHNFRHACDFRVQPMPPMTADIGLMSLVYQELIDNALHATAETTKAEIEVGFSDGAYYVRDNGVGFEPDFAETLFDLFRKYNYATSTTGAGLALVKRIISLHGGTISAEGTPSGGAIFRFTIPEAPGATRPAPPSVLTHREAGRPRG